MLRLAGALAALLLLASCGPARENRIVIGSKNFTEQLVLGEIIAQQIENKTHLPVERRFYLAGSYICHQAILGGRIDIYPEYTGTALTAILKQQPSNNPEQVYNQVKTEYARQFNLEVGKTFGFNDTFAIEIRGEDARRLGLKTLSQAPAYTPKWRAGFGYEFMERPDGYKGLAATYGLHFATLFVLEDDKHYFPPYEAVPIIRQEMLAHHPEVGQALNELAGRISDDDMRQLNYAVDGQHRDVKQVVRQFLSKKGL